ncbi:hypothetical protein EGW08_018700 [Elysia chlorotica]|uniref:Uncharacterized protein n=1 Tax=Elysia chlorotica TaxID=188477 RepID=A0A433SW75_ELYCH|nr:hypothetical protein EGW08_018700 [Elysia chlorotica]
MGLDLTYATGSPEEHRAKATPLHLTRFWASLFSSVHVLPALLISASILLRHVCLGRPTFRLPCRYLAISREMSNSYLTFLTIVALKEVTVAHGQGFAFSTELSYWQLSSGMRGLFRSEMELLKNTVLLSGGPSQPRIHTIWINSQSFLVNHQDVEKTISEFMLDNQIRGVGSVEFNSGRYVQGCCPQLTFYSAIDSLPNINGVRKYLVHFEKEGKYQYVPFSLCAGQDKYGDHGHCFQGTTVLNLLAYETERSPPVSFDQFEIPTYCGCVQY